MSDFVKMPEWAMNLVAVTGLGIAGWALIAAVDNGSRTAVLEKGLEASDRQQDRLIDAITNLNEEITKLRISVAQIHQGD